VVDGSAIRAGNSNNNNNNNNNNIEILPSLCGNYLVITLDCDGT